MVLLLMIAAPAFLFAQETITVKGQVKDATNNEALIGAYVYARGTDKATETDINGFYKLTFSIPKGRTTQTITISYVGYRDDRTTIKIEPGDVINSYTKNFDLMPSALELGKVTVTANKVEEELQDVPVAATVIGTRNMRDRTVSTTEDALASVPNLLTDSYLPSQPTFSIRGLSTNFADNGAENEVGLYIDDVYYSRAYSFNTTLMDIERVEVLRGPQGSLFGKNTVGGVLHIISEQPKMGTSGAVELTSGNYQFTQVRGKANIMPIKDKLALRFTGAYKSRQGWLREENQDVADANQTKFWGFRGAALIKPTEKLEISLKGNYSRDNAAEFTIDLMADSDDNKNLFKVENATHTDRVVNQSEENADFFRDNKGYVGKVKYKINDLLTFNSITAYNDAYTEFYRDFDVTPEDAMTYKASRWYNSFSQEMRVSTPREGRKFFFVGGLYYLNEQIQTHDTLRLFSAMQEVYRQQYNDPSINYPDYFEGGCTHGIIDAKSYAAYASTSIEVGERIRLNTGMRITMEEKAGRFWQMVNHFPKFSGIDTYLTQIASTDDPLRQSVSDKAWSGNIGLDFKTSQKTLVYINVSRGFKGSGFNIALNPDPTASNIAYKPEFLNSYEFGVKVKHNSRYRFNAAAFVTDYKDKQEAAPVGAALRVTNAKSANGVGFEAEFTGLWSEYFRTDVALGALSLEYHDFAFVDQAGNPINLSGNKLYKAPDVTFKFSPEFNYPLGADLKVKLRADYNYTGKTYNDIYNTESIAREGTGILNARLAFSFAKEKYSLALWAKNLTDALYIQHGWITNVGNHASVNPPRTLGMEIRANFY